MSIVRKNTKWKIMRHEKLFFDERDEAAHQQTPISSFFCSFLSSSSFITQITQTPTISYPVSFLLLYKISALLSHSFLPPSLCSFLFPLCLYSLPLSLAQPLFSWLPGSCCSVNSLTSCLASCLLLQSHKVSLCEIMLLNVFFSEFICIYRHLLIRQHSSKMCENVQNFVSVDFKNRKH